MTAKNVANAALIKEVSATPSMEVGSGVVVVVVKLARVKRQEASKTAKAVKNFIAL